jgi:hypothetical protein
MAGARKSDGFLRVRAGAFSTHWFIIAHSCLVSQQIRLTPDVFDEIISSSAFAAFETEIAQLQVTTFYNVEYCLCLL